jgi:hypothetical protein
MQRQDAFSDLRAAGKDRATGRKEPVDSPSDIRKFNFQEIGGVDCGYFAFQPGA